MYIEKQEATKLVSVFTGIPFTLQNIPDNLIVLTYFLLSWMSFIIHMSAHKNFYVWTFKILVRICIIIIIYQIRSDTVIALILGVT